MTEYFKTAQFLMYPSRPGPGWILQHRQSGGIVPVPDECCRDWENGSLGRLRVIHPGLVKSLIDHGMIIAGGELEPEPKEHPLDPVVPKIPDHFIKTYSESCDTKVLFNSNCMRQNNPLLVLSPYGSLCWRLLREERPIGEIRRTAQRIFGTDEVLPFLKRLLNLGFLSSFDQPVKWGQPKPERILKEFPSPAVQFEMPRTRIPWYLLWELCTICDLRCQTCYLSDFDHPGAPIGDLFNWGQQWADAGMFYVALMGGEVLLRDDLENLVGFLRDRGLFVKIITNGKKLDLSRARALARAGLNQIEISFDGLTAQTHEASRGPNTFGQACRALLAAEDAGIPRRAIVWTLHSGNIGDVDLLSSLMSKVAVDECYISTFRKTGALGTFAPWNPLSKRQDQAVRLSLARIRRENPHLTITLSSECSCGRSSIVISPDGSVRLCPFSAEHVGNLGKESLAEIWARMDQICQGKGPFGFCRNLQQSSET